MKTKAPIWLKFFAVSVLMLFFVVLLVTTVYMYQMLKKENSIVDSNISNSTYYANLSVENTLSVYSERIGSMSAAEQFYQEQEKGEQEYRTAVREKLASVYSESSEILAIFFQSASGQVFSIGEIFWDINSQIKMIHDCKSKPEYSRSKGLWRYESIGRGFHSIVLCRDIIYVTDQYEQRELGTVLLYMDADKINQTLFSENQGNGIVIIDPYGAIALSADQELMGKSFEDVFQTDDGSVLKDGKRYLARKQESSLGGWNILSYIDMNMTSRSVYQTTLRMMGLVLLGLLLVGTVSYFLSRRIGKPIEELLNYIRINPFGVVESVHEDEETKDDIAQIKQVFERLSEDLKKNIQSNYKMQLMLKDTKIKAYESQMNPHFLFNTLQMIQMLNVLGKQEDVETATTCLGDLLRFNLDNRNEVTLREEVNNVLNYLRILEFRFKGRFDYKIMIPDSLMDCYTIKFMLQPIIENSVTHGFKEKKGLCELVIMGQEINGEIVVVVKDNGNGISRDQLLRLKESLKSHSEPRGIGLANVHERIQLIYGEQYGVDIFSDYEKNTQVIIHIPVCRHPQEKEAEYVQISDH